jgi:hypothetical protein
MGFLDEVEAFVEPFPVGPVEVHGGELLVVADLRRDGLDIESVVPEGAGDRDGVKWRATG